MDMCNAEIELEADSYGWIDFYGVGDSYDNDGFVMNGSNSTQSDPFKVVSSVFQTLLTLNNHTPVTESTLATPTKRS